MPFNEMIASWFSSYLMDYNPTVWCRRFPLAFPTFCERLISESLILYLVVRKILDELVDTTLATAAGFTAPTFIVSACPLSNLSSLWIVVSRDMISAMD
jgi:hypothetical protein